MKSFKQYQKDLETSIEVSNLVELSMFMDMDIDDVTQLNEDTQIDEALDLNKAMKKVGLHVQKGRGLMQIFASAGKHIVQVMWYAVKAYGGDEDAKVKLKELLKKKVSKEDILDVILKLDAATMHVITGPIHTIDAITGWHLWANVQKVANVAGDIKKKVKDAIDTLKTMAKNVEGKIKSRIEKTVDVVDALFTSARVKA